MTCWSLKKNIIKKAIHLSNSFSKSKASIIEEFVTGDLYSHSAEVRSVSEDASKPIRTTGIKIVAPSTKYTNRSSSLFV